MTPRRHVQAAALVLTLASSAHAQDVKGNCADASERGQKLVDARQLLEARNAFLACAQETCPAAVRRDCQAQIDDIKKNIPSIVVRVKNADGSDVAQGTVALDGVAVGTLDGALLEANPGAHAVRVTLPDGRTLDQQVVLAPGDRSRNVVFGPKSPEAPQTPKPAEGGTKMQWTPLRSIGFVTIWVGAAGLTAGIVSYVLSSVSQSNAVSEQNLANGSGNACFSLDADAYSGYGPPEGACANAVQYHSDALTEQTVALVSLVAGAAVLAGGLIMFFVGGSRPATAFNVVPLVGPRFGGIGFGMSF